ncbi:serine/threonine-protein kinase [Actinomadura geliboluensis]|uniref:serine/threonine-protein kinase n=1 Tax=Actinomadura geliboluensis TaxID=882440 RepID=UPI002624D7FB|nr:serine/threonine-protein kinase [Actinomadura geliboluensis]
MKGAVTSGDRIGHYSVLQTLGEGGMGVVYLGADAEGRNVAIKVLRPAVAGDATARRRLAREVDSMRRVHSPHVAEILDADVTADQPYIVTQYVPGRTLEEVVEDAGPIYGPGLQRLGVGLAAALSAIHGAGIVHRDMKPGNVMLVDGEPVVIDFGIAQAADATRLTATGMVIGTPGYLAPEIIEGEDAGPPSDVHAWAGTVAYAATGRPPFGSGTFESIFYKIMQGTPDLDGVPDALLPVLRSAMARHPAERPTAVKLVQLTRRIHLEATITDQTRVDRHYPAPAVPPVAPADGTSVDEPAPDHSRMFSMPVTGAPPDTSQDVPAPPPPATTPGGNALPAPAPAPVPAQPRDFVGQLPPAAPPPPPPGPPPAQFKAGEQFGGRGYAPPDPYGQSGAYPPYAPPPNQPHQPPPNQPPPGALQRGGPYDAQTQDAQRRVADQARADRERAERADRDRRKPYGWYRVLSFIVLVALLAFANIAPLLALGVTIGGVFVLRAADKAAKGMEGRQTRRGPRSGDAVAAAFRTPLHLPGALMSTVLWTSLSLLAGLVMLGVLIFAQSDMTASKAIAYSSMAVIGLLCLAPGSGAPRRQLARIWGALLPRAEAALAGALVLGIFAGVLAGLSQRQPPDTTPLDGMGQSLEGLRADVRDLVSNIPGL